MRFSETLRFNANPDWWTHYLPYDELKQQLYLIRKLQTAIDTNTQVDSPQPEESTDDEAEHPYPVTSHDIQSHHQIPIHRTASQRVLADLNRNKNFKSAPGYSGILSTQRFTSHSSIDVYQLPGQSHRSRLDFLEDKFLQDLEKYATSIDQFYNMLSKELDKVTTEMENDTYQLLTRMNQINLSSSFREHTPLLYPEADVETSVQLQPPSEEELQFFKTKLVKHYKELGETVNFASLNRNAFKKITKKHDKISNRTLRDEFMKQLESTTAFVNTSRLAEMQHQIEKFYHNLFIPNQNEEVARTELREELRDLIIWDRNTIWRDILRKERKVSAIHTIKGGKDIELQNNARVNLKVKLIPALTALFVFVLILMFPQIVRSLTIENGPKYSDSTLDAAHRCLAIAIAAIILWATDGVPLFITSIMIVPTSILLHVFLDKEGAPLDTSHAAKLVFANMTSQTIILIICVYSLGAALTKFQIDRLVATNILSRLKREDHLLAAAMILAVLVSMFVSNVAAPVLLISVMMPTIDAMSGSEHNRRYIRCLLLGIMVSSNIGGFASTIASPQSLVAIGLLTGKSKISFLKWLIVAWPQIIVMLFAFYILLAFQFRVGRAPLPRLPRASNKIGWPHIVIFVSISLTVLIWALHDVCEKLGGEGVVAMLPIITLFGSGILTKEDFNNLPWDVVYLVAGGSVLGAAVESCKLLDLVANRLTEWLGEGSLRVSYYLFCTFMAFVANFVSHTVTAIIVLPLVYRVGESLGHPQLLVVGGTFAASCAMSLAISSFPNISVTKVEDERGDAYVSAGEVLKYGMQMTIVATIVLLFFGGEYMLTLGL